MPEEKGDLSKARDSAQAAGLGLSGTIMRHNRSLIERVWAREPRYRAIWVAATPLSAVYAVMLAARSVWWRAAARRAPLPTISVGNLTTGGNAKTPFTLFLAERLRQRGLRIGIVSRGYRGHSARSAKLVSDGRRLLLTPREAGDEPVMLAKLFDGPVAVARRRINGIELLAAGSALDAVVLDDAFQHVRLRREVDLLLLSERQGVGNGWLLPAGPLRERLRAIRRAHAVVMVGVPGAHKQTFAAPLLDGKLVLKASLEPAALIQLVDGCWHERPPALAGRRVVAVSGIADPTSFYEMLSGLGAHLVSALEYPDHHDYRPTDWDNIVAAATVAEMVVTTEKDLIKLERFVVPETAIYALRLKLTMDEREEARLLTMIMEKVTGLNRPSSAA